MADARPALTLTDERRATLEELVGRWLILHPPPGATPAADGHGGAITVHHAEVLRPGRPGLVDVLATVGGRTAHAVLGLHRPGAQPHFLRSGEEAVFGLLDDETGLGVVVDALGDAEMASVLLEAVGGAPEGAEAVTVVADDPDGVTLAFPGRTMTVFGWPADGPHPGVELLVALDDAGFNHLPAPLALWRRGGRDLGVVQEVPPGTAPGSALALGSLRDLFASGGRPEDAGADFGPESHAIGVMAARMHLALDRAFGRRSTEVASWMDGVERVVRARGSSALDAGPAAATVAALRGAGLRFPALRRTHGDFRLERLARADVGWLVADVLPGGRPPGADDPVERSPLADVADLVWSLHRVAETAAAARDPSGLGAPGPAGRDWEARNRRAFLAGYLSTPGIGGLVPTDRQLVGDLVAVLEVARAAADAPD